MNRPALRGAPTLPSQRERADRQQRQCGGFGDEIIVRHTRSDDGFHRKSAQSLHAGILEPQIQLRLVRHDSRRLPEPKRTRYFFKKERRVKCRRVVKPKGRRNANPGQALTRSRAAQMKLPAVENLTGICLKDQRVADSAIGIRGIGAAFKSCPLPGDHTMRSPTVSSTSVSGCSKSVQNDHTKDDLFEGSTVSMKGSDVAPSGPKNEKLCPTRPGLIVALLTCQFSARSGRIATRKRKTMLRSRRWRCFFMTGDAAGSGVLDR